MHMCGTWTDNQFFSEINENTNSSKSEDELQKEEEVIAVPIQQAKHVLKTLRNFVETITGIEYCDFSVISN